MMIPRFTFQRPLGRSPRVRAIVSISQETLGLTEHPVGQPPIPTAILIASPRVIDDIDE